VVSRREGVRSLIREPWPGNQEPDSSNFLLLLLDPSKNKER
jgi:hypothetical protein